MSLYQNSYGNLKLTWPYPVRYEEETVVEVDVLVIGGGLSGAAAAIAASRAGSTVAVVDKAPQERAGSGGVGIDHWNGALTNPCSTITPEEFVEWMEPKKTAIDSIRYISARRSYDVLLEIEKMGLPIRDEDDEFKGAPFRDEETKLLFAYDYKNRFDIKLRGGDRLKPVMYEETKKSGAQIFERVMITSLLTEGGKTGAPVVGATGLNIQTGEFYIFKAKAVILASGCPKGIWIYNTELRGSAAEFADPNNTGDGIAMAWNAGARITLMYRAGNVHGGGAFGWPEYGVGNCDNTWFPCNLVDATGKPIPWIDGMGDPLPIDDVDARNQPAGEQRYISTALSGLKNATKPRIIKDLHERIRSGEFKLPLYADLPSMPEQERRSIWGLMVGNEGKTRFAVYDHYAEAGFNPDTDMLQAPMMAPESYGYGDFFGWYHGENKICKVWRDSGIFRSAGGPLTDWTLMTNVPGLFAAGLTSTGGGASTACATGWHAAQCAARYARDRSSAPQIDQSQLKKEKGRVYAPVRRRSTDDYIGWKELWAGTARVMQCYCSDYKTDLSLQMGLDWLKSIRENELTQTYARNPHELVRVLECESRLTVSELFLIGCKSKYLADQENIKDQFIVDQLVDENGEYKTTYLDKFFYLKAPYEPTLKENFEKYRAD